MEGIPEPDEITNADLILSANRALLCEVRKNMRKVSVEYYRDTKTIIVNFFYDTPPTQDEKDYDVEGNILTEMDTDFPYEVAIEARSFVIPYPERLPQKGYGVFRRYEPPPKGEEGRRGGQT